VPLASDKLDAVATALIDRISAAMSAEDLVALKTERVETAAPASTLASQWLADSAAILEGATSTAAGGQKEERKRARVYLMSVSEGFCPNRRR